MQRSAIHQVDATIVEISTDKVDVELPAPATGTVSELLVGEGDTVTVGQVIARISVKDDGAPETANGSPSPAPPAATETAERGAGPGTDGAKRDGESTDGAPAAARAGRRGRRRNSSTSSRRRPASRSPRARSWSGASSSETRQARRDDRRDLDRQGRRRAPSPPLARSPRPSSTRATRSVGQVIARIAVERTSGDGRPAPATPAP
jgi:pyruvate/2-oxoglutarate dehydrogenase complex dihydrolipoamide acyltransferase (E2) component